MSDKLSSEQFTAILGRLAEALGLSPYKTTQVQMAEALGIRQSSISDAKRRGSIPSEWFLKALEISSVGPEWIRTGNGPKFRVLSDTPNGALNKTKISKSDFKETIRKISDKELLDAIKNRFPSGTIVTLNCKLELECTGLNEGTIR